MLHRKHNSLLFGPVLMLPTFIKENQYKTVFTKKGALARQKFIIYCDLAQAVLVNLLLIQ